jgi:tRNA (mo5U34)-methyltransferase
MTREEKVRRIQSRTWYHSIEVEPGLVTPGSLSSHTLRRMLEYLQFPASLAGLSVLDIGAWDGFYSFEAERRGAKRVVAYDLSPADFIGFSTAKELLESNVEYRQGSVYDLRAEVVGTFDVVLFLGVFYHLRYPLLALDRIREVCTGYMLFETHFLDNNLLLSDGTSVLLERIDPRLAAVPLYRFYRSNELNRDFSNWFSPNRQAIEDGLWTAGFEPRRLAEWGDRIAYKGTRLDAVPEYLQGTYEGFKFVSEPGGGYRFAGWERPTSGSVPRGPVGRTRSILRRILLWLLWLLGGRA